MAPSRKSDKPRFDLVLNAIDEGQIKPIYILHGPNVTLIDQALSKLKAVVVGENEDFAYQVLRGDEASGHSILDAARTLPMLAERQLILVRQADQLKADDQAVLLRYLEDPTPTTCLVLVATKIDKRLKFFNRAAKLGFVHEAGSITERELAGWLGTRARDFGLKMSPQVAHVLGDATGTDPTTIEDALERLSLYLGDRSEVSEADVETIVSSSRVHSIFELTDALGRRDVGSALRTLTNMLQNREAPLRILATLSTHMRRLLHAAELGDSMLRQHFELASALGVPPFLARKIAEQARRFSRRELRRALHRLAETDLELKGSKRPDELIMEEMVLALCLGSPPASHAAKQRRRRPWR